MIGNKLTSLILLLFCNIYSYAAVSGQRELKNIDIDSFFCLIETLILLEQPDFTTPVTSRQYSTHGRHERGRRHIAAAFFGNPTISFT